MSSWTGGTKKYSNSLDSARRSGKSPSRSSGGGSSSSASSASSKTPGIIAALNKDAPKSQNTFGVTTTSETANTPLYENNVRARGGSSNSRVVDREQAAFAKENAKAGTANYQTTTGEVQQVTYSRVQERKIGDAGITRELDRKGALGKPMFGEQLGFSAANVRVDPYQKRPSEIRNEFYDSERARYRNSGFREQVSRDRVTLGLMSGQAQRENPSFTGESWKRTGEFVLSRPVSYAGTGLQTLGQGGYTIGLRSMQTGDDSLATKGFVYGSTVVRELGVYGKMNPTGVVSDTAVYGIAGAGGGALLGAGVRGASAAGWLKTARTANVGKDVAFAGMAGYTALSAPSGEELGRAVPSLVAGGGGFIKGYRSVVPPASLTVRPTGRFRSMTDSYTDSGRMVSITGRQRFAYEYTELGVTKRGYSMAEMQAVTPSQPTNLAVVEYKVRGRMNYRTLNGKRTARVSYDARYDPDYNLFAGIDRRGNAFEVRTSPQVMTVADGGVSQEAVGVRTTMYTGRRITGVTEGVNVREGAATRQFLTQDYSSSMAVRVNRPVRGTGLGYDRTVLTGGSRDVISYRGGAELVLPAETRGFRLLQEQGLYQEPWSAYGRRAGRRAVDAFDESFLNPRSRRLYSNTVFEPLARRPVEITRELPLRGGRRIPDFNRIPMRGFRGSGFSMFPLVGVGIANRNNLRTGGEQRNRLITGERTIQTSRTVYDVDVSTAQTPREDTFTIQDTDFRRPTRGGGTFFSRVPIPPPPVVPPSRVVTGDIFGQSGGRLVQGSARSRTGFSLGLESFEGLSIGNGLLATKTPRGGFTGFEKRVRRKGRRKK